MNPFSDFPFLRQAFTEGETWRAEDERIEQAESERQLTPDAAKRIRKEGAIGSHLEVIERRQGFKGFNQDSVSVIIRATDPRQVRMRGA